MMSEGGRMSYEPELGQHKHQRVLLLRKQITEMVAIAASEVGGLTSEQADEWWDELQEALTDGMEAVTDD